MEFEDEHDEEQEEEEDDEEDITIPPPTAPPSYTPPPTLVPHRVNSAPSSETRRSGVVRYRECLKNHAINIGGHAVDGCGEFMAAGEDGTLDALKCAACNCHRNFHRKEFVNDSGGGGGGIDAHAPQHHHLVTTPPPPPPPNMGSANAGNTGTTNTTLYPQFSAYYRTPAPPSGYLHVSSHRPLSALPSSYTSGGTHSGDMGDDMSHPSSSGGCGRDSGGGMMMSESSGKKRFRTKFTQEQKDKMLAFAEKLGWRIQKHDEAAVQHFCAEIQVKRQVLKVWMHNNKHTLGKKP